MIADVAYVERKFREFNQQMFAGQLPEIPVYLNRFPTSSALRVNYVDAEEIRAHLKDAEVLGCDGKSITRNKHKG